MPISKGRPVIRKPSKKSEETQIRDNKSVVDATDDSSYNEVFDNDIIDLCNPEIDEIEETTMITKENYTTNEKTTPIMKKTSSPCNYSSIAKKDGYDFSFMSPYEQEITQSLYISEEAMSNILLASRKMSEMTNSPEDKHYINYSWGLPYEGYYFGIVYDCKPSMKRENSFVLQLLVSDYDVCSFQFSTSMLDPISGAISNELGIYRSIFRCPDYSLTIGKIVILKVVDVKLKNGTTYSKVSFFHFLDEEELAVMEKMLEAMNRP